MKYKCSLMFGSAYIMVCLKMRILFDLMFLNQHLLIHVGTLPVLKPDMGRITLESNALNYIENVH